MAEKCRNLGEELLEEPDAPAIADGDGGHADRVKIGLLLLKEEIDKPLRKLEDCLNGASYAIFPRVKLNRGEVARLWLKLH